jgi:methylaspartate mutase epsilon subunit
MFDDYRTYETRRGKEAPDWAETVSHLRASGKPTVAGLLAQADAEGRMLVQPRCGVGGQEAMAALLQGLEAGGAPDVLSLTIDAHTRLLRLDVAERTLKANPGNLNGYPLIAHGWRRGRALDALVRAPIEVRHGSPDARLLFAATVASGITSFEGGGLTYNIPYCKDVPLAESLAAWRDVDQLSGDLAAEGVIVDRELFGTLTAVLMPPCVGISIALIEAILAAQAGVRCLSMAYCQTGHFAQDIAALRALRSLAARSLPEDVAAYPVFHQFMGAFPGGRAHADALIAYGAITARLGGATKIINKTHQEAFGVPTVEANVGGIGLTRMATSWILDLVPVDLAAVDEEQHWIEREVAEIVEPLLAKPDLAAAVVAAFAEGRLDVPFSASVHARADTLPVPDATGATRVRRWGEMPVSEAVRSRHARLCDAPGAPELGGLFEKIRSDILFFCRDTAPLRAQHQAAA